MAENKPPLSNQKSNQKCDRLDFDNDVGGTGSARSDSMSETSDLEEGEIFSTDDETIEDLTARRSLMNTILNKNDEKSTTKHKEIKNTKDTGSKIKSLGSAGASYVAACKKLKDEIVTFKKITVLDHQKLKPKARSPDFKKHQKSPDITKNQKSSEIRKNKKSSEIGKNQNSHTKKKYKSPDTSKKNYKSPDTSKKDYKSPDMSKKDYKSPDMNKKDYKSPEMKKITKSQEKKKNHNNDNKPNPRRTDENMKRKSKENSSQNLQFKSLLAECKKTTKNDGHGPEKSEKPKTCPYQKRSETKHKSDSDSRNSSGNSDDVKVIQEQKGDEQIMDKSEPDSIEEILDNLDELPSDSSNSENDTTTNSDSGLKRKHFSDKNISDKEPPSKKLKINSDDLKINTKINKLKIKSNEHKINTDKHKINADDLSDGAIDDSSFPNAQEFQIIDDLNDNMNDNNRMSDDDEMMGYMSEDLDDNEIYAWLEEGVSRRRQICNQDDIPFDEKEKSVLVEKGVDPFEVLPEGWVAVTHNCGMPVYLHKQTRVCTMSKPYFLGPGSLRKHDLPASAIPCLQYRKQIKKEQKQEACMQAPHGSESNSQAVVSSELNYQAVDSSKTSNQEIQSSESTKLTVESTNLTYASVESSETNNQTVQSSKTNNQTVQSSDSNSQEVESTELNDQSVENLETSNQTVQSSETNNQTVQSSDSNGQEVESTELKDQSVENLETSNQAVQSSDSNSQEVESTELNNQSVENSETDSQAVQSSETNSQELESTQLNDHSVENLETRAVQSSDSSSQEVENTEMNNQSVENSETDNQAMQSTNSLEVENTEFNVQSMENSETNNQVVQSSDSRNQEVQSSDLSNHALQSLETSSQTAQSSESMTSSSQDLQSTEISSQTVNGESETGQVTENGISEEDTMETSADDVTDLDKTLTFEEKVEDANNLDTTLSEDKPQPKAGPPVIIESVEERKKENSLSADEVLEYCKNLFEFKTVTVKKFKTWKERRKHLNEVRKQSRPGLPSHMKLLTCTIPTGNGNEKPKKKDFVLNPQGKSPVCILHEYAQHTLKVQPRYTFQELENAQNPYCATVLISNIEYGKGYASSKKLAKINAAKTTLGILIPEMNNIEVSKEQKEDLSFFDEIKIEDPRVFDLCTKTGQPSPYQILLECLKRNYGMGDTHVKTDVKPLKHQKSEYTLSVGKHSVTIVCKNKREGKQKAAQAMLQQLHTHINSLGSLLRLYGQSAGKVFKEKKKEEVSVTELQTQKHANRPNTALLDKLRREMTKLQSQRKSLTSKGSLLIDSVPGGVTSLDF